eukprot:CAMPEP_0202970102 /NCGR_PEP_ID=MMETSP1396-20130829/16076_1 /ASSEMBLY_ACC=CAM_ASM_000872 /TAXON_ID= /ORGANISM="Pseudokeronopsis sp., Strain Brazil" /LENGTH=89 /DNA_ID=CAMNT_0049698385 /DNA_START=62 /DNA_END=331 /DNA_ORIENTATION=+
MADNKQVQHELQRIMLKYDKDKNNVLDKDEVKALVHDLIKEQGVDADKLDKESLAELFKTVIGHLDVNQDGSIQKEELQAYLVNTYFEE